MSTRTQVLLKTGEDRNSSQVVEREVTERLVFRTNRRRRVGERMSI